MIRKLLAFILLGLFTIQVIGFVAYFSFEKKKIKKQLKTMLKEGVPDYQLKTFTLTKKQFQALHFVKTKEFKIKDRFYDIVKKENLANGKIILRCVDDIQESQLFKNLAFLVDDHISKQTNSPLKTVFSIVIKPMISNEIPTYSIVDFGPITKKPYYTYQELNSSSFLKTVVPPPKTFC